MSCCDVASPIRQKDASLDFKKLLIRIYSKYELTKSSNPPCITLDNQQTLEEIVIIGAWTLSNFTGEWCMRSIKRSNAPSLLQHFSEVSNTTNCGNFANTEAIPHPSPESLDIPCCRNNQSGHHQLRQ